MNSHAGVAAALHKSDSPPAETQTRPLIDELAVQPPDDLPVPWASMRFEEGVMVLLLAVLVLITFANVVSRYLTNISFAFTEEYSVVLMMILALVGSARAVAQDRHIRVTFLAERLPAVWRLRVELGVQLLAIACFACLGLTAAHATWEEFRFNSVSMGLGNPEWLYSIWIPPLSVLVIVRALGRFVVLLRAGSPREKS